MGWMHSFFLPYYSSENKFKIGDGNYKIWKRFLFEKDEI